MVRGVRRSLTGPREGDATLVCLLAKGRRVTSWPSYGRYDEQETSQLTPWSIPVSPTPEGHDGCDQPHEDFRFLLMFCYYQRFLSRQPPQGLRRSRHDT